MFRSLFRFFAVSVLAVVGDPGHLWRLSVCVLVGGVVTVTIYWLSADLLPLWPGVAVMSVAAALGVFWTSRAERASERMLR